MLYSNTAHADQGGQPPHPPSLSPLLAPARSSGTQPCSAERRAVRRLARPAAHGATNDSDESGGELVRVGPSRRPSRHAGRNTRLRHQSGPTNALVPAVERAVDAIGEAGYTIAHGIAAIAHGIAYGIANGTAIRDRPTGGYHYPWYITGHGIYRRR